MKTIAHEAQRLALLFEYGVLTGDEVVAWADSAIIQMDSPPDSLIELSTTAPEKTAAIISNLGLLASGSDFWPALRSAIPQIRDFIVQHPDRAESIANHLFLTACYQPNEVPKDLNFIWRFDDAFSLAGEGSYGKPEAVYRDFLQELDKAIMAA